MTLPLVSDQPVTCFVVGDVCVSYGDITVGRLDGTGSVVPVGLFEMNPSITAEGNGRRLTPAVLSAYWWPDGIVSAVSSSAELLVGAWFRSSYAISCVCFANIMC